MCGIIGCVSTENIVPKVVEGLKKLEYRGYDSAGIALHSSPIKIYKNIGKVDELIKILPTPIGSNIAIAHTRWATHGNVTIENAHPHTDCLGKIAVVHNGIIENYSELKSYLKSKGHTFRGETDTEVIPHLIEDFIKEGYSFRNAVEKSLEKVKGTYAVAVIHNGENKLIAARRGSPLVIGIGKNETFVASDIPPFLDHTRKVIYLYDEDIVEIDNDVKIFNNNQKVNREVVEITWDAEQVKKGNFQHFMLKEICEQADVLHRAVTQDDKKIMSIARQIKEAKNVFFLACGTSAHACQSASYVFSKGPEIYIPVVIGSEFSHYKNFISKDTLIIAISQSGETADVIGPIRKSKELGARVISIVNVMGSTIQRESDEFLLLNAMPEIAVASTKAYTAMLSVLYLLAYATMEDLEGGKIRLKNLYNVIYNLTTINTRDHILQISEKLKNSEHVYVIGRDSQFPTAQEAALKIKEISYIHAEALPAGELKHGTLALITKGTPVIALFSEDNEQATLNNIMEIKSRGGYIIGVGYHNHENFDSYIKTLECKALNPIVQIIPMQILAYQLSVLRGNNPDMPRNLAKSVTVM